ncbi:MAG TPA: hypothetical protein VJB38_11380 [Bacteroidota bacterium]|nr:hypothetical protein [Bacteroidota bacterium]
MPQSLARILVHFVFSTKYQHLTKFAWQDGYGVFSLRHSEVERVRTCVGAEYDGRYVWG